MSRYDSSNGRRNVNSGGTSQPSNRNGNGSVNPKDNGRKEGGRQEDVRKSNNSAELLHPSHKEPRVENPSTQGSVKGAVHPCWVALEGIDGCGKSTQTALVAEYFGATTFRFPTDPLVIVEALETSNPIERMLVFMADMVGSATMIRAIKKDGGMAISDRSAISSYAYQATKSIHGDYSSTDLYKSVKVPSLIPDLVIYIRIPLSEALSRIKARNGEISEFEQKDKLERTYAQMEAIVEEIKSDTKVAIVNGLNSKEAVTASIIKIIKEMSP